MYLDAFTLSALVDEFLDEIVGGRIQDSVSVDQWALGMEIYANRKRHYLFLSAEHQHPRIHLVPDKLRRGTPKPTQLALMLRRYAELGTITHVSQPAWERILQIEIDGPEGQVVLVIEPMERRGNILLLRDGIILDCLRRVGPEENRYRLSLPNHAYMLPPPQTGKLNPLTLTQAQLAQVLNEADDPKAKTVQALSSRLLGVSPLLAKEMVHRASGSVAQKVGDVDVEGLFAALTALIEPLRKREWQPGIAETDDGVAAYSVYPLTHLAGWHRVDSLSMALSAYYGAAVGEEAYTAAKKTAQANIEEAQDKLRGKLVSLERAMTDDSEREVLRKSGELILAYQYILEEGQSELRAQYDPDEPELVIKLDPQQSPKENAEHYFTKYNKAKRALDDVPALIEETKQEMGYLAQLTSDLALAANWPEIDEVQQALQARGYWKGKRAQRIGGTPSGPMRLTKDGYVIWVGRNSRQNEIVTFDKGGGESLWLHVRDVPGAHVVIRFDGRPIPESLIMQAAAVAAYYSSKRDDKAVIVDVTQCKYVKKIKGGAPGMVIYRNEETRTVTPQDETIFDG